MPDSTPQDQPVAAPPPSVDPSNLQASVDARQGAADPAAAGQHPAHPVIKGLLDMIASGMKSYAAGTEDPRLGLQREETSARLAQSKAQMEETQAWRMAMVGEKQRHDVANETTNKEKADTGAATGQTNALRYGIDWVTDPKTGKTTPQAQGLDDPNMSPKVKADIQASIQKSALGDALLNYRNAQSEYTKAKTGAIPTELNQKQQALDIANKKLEESLKALGMRREELGMKEEEHNANYEPWNLTGQAAAAQPTDIAGNPVGFRNPLRPGQTTMNAAQRASNIVTQLPRLTQEVKEMQASIGPDVGRWNRFWQGDVGAADPKFAHLRDDMEFASSAIALAHAYGRLPQTISDKFDKMYEAGKQDPQNMLAALDVAQQWLPKIMQGGMSAGEKGPATTTDKTSPPRPARVPPDFVYNANGPKGPGWYKP